MSGEPVTYTNWGVGEPNNQGNEDWVAMDVTMQPPGAWNDSPGLGSLPGIIEVISGDCNSNQIPDRTEVTSGAAPDCNGNGIPDTCDIVSGSSVDSNGDSQPDECQPAGFTFCAGDGSGAVCPCDPGQAGNPGEGCRHSHGLGAKLSGIGTARIAQDSLRLTASQLPPSATALLFQGTTMQNGGLGFSFGDGLLCVNGTIVRLSIRQATGGVLSWGAGNPGDAPLHLAGSIPASGGTRFYQVWYRDPSPYCTPSGFNLTGGRSITWTP
ncbi:MAG: hypothetical protein NTY35_16400 [Planctomycetota bacterium]|nr:hypothetical protein [Planctomycetota bacterium]